MPMGTQIWHKLQHKHYRFWRFDTSFKVLMLSDVCEILQWRGHGPLCNTTSRARKGWGGGGIEMLEIRVPQILHYGRACHGRQLYTWISFYYTCKRYIFPLGILLWKVSQILYKMDEEKSQLANNLKSFTNQFQLDSSSFFMCKNADFFQLGHACSFVEKNDLLIFCSIKSVTSLH